MNIIEKVAYRNATKLAFEIDRAAIQVLNPPKWICEMKDDAIILQREWIYKIYCWYRGFDIKVARGINGDETYYFYIKGKIRKILKLDL